MVTKSVWGRILITVVIIQEGKIKDESSYHSNVQICCLLETVEITLDFDSCILFVQKSHKNNYEILAWNILGNHSYITLAFVEGKED